MESKKNLKKLTSFILLSLFIPFSLFAVPVINDVNPHSGPSTGGQTVTIQGTGFAGTTQVLFGPHAAAIVSVTATTVVVTTPASVPSTVDVQITSGSGTSITTQFDRYAFQGNWTAFIPDFGSNNVFTSNTSTMLVDPNPINVGTQPNDVCVSSDGTQAFVVNSGSSDITPIDILTLTPGTNLPTDGGFPILMALTVDPVNGHEIGYTANYTSQTVSRIDLTSGSPPDTIGVGANPSSGAVVLDLTQNPPVPLYLYVTNVGSSNITVIRLSDFSVLTTLNTGPGSAPSFICIDPNGTTAYYTDDNPSLNSVTQILNVNTPTPSFGTVYTDPSFNFSGQNLFPQIAVSPDGLNLYVTNTGTNTVSYINLATSAICPITVQFGPNGAAITPDGSELYVCNSVSNAISIVSGLPSCSPNIVNLLVGTLPTDPSITPDPAPLAFFMATPTSAEPGETITFDPTLSASPVGTIARYDWDFGDGNTVTTFPNSPLATHSYNPISPPQTYTVSLTVTNTAGTSVSTSYAYNGKQVLRDGGPSAFFTLPILVTPKVTIPTVTTLTTNPANTAILGQNVIFTAVVTSNSGTPNGQVQFFVDGNPYGAPVTLDGTGTAMIGDSTLTGGSHIITAMYLGNSTYDPSLSNPAPINITLDGTTVGIISSQPVCAIYGSPITFTATVTADNPGISGIPTGTVLFIDTSTSPQTIIGGGTLVGGTASFTTNASSILSVGPHQIVASYSGDMNHSANNSPPFTQNVCPANTTTVITSSMNPSPYGDLITFFATVTAVPPGGGIPQGLVEFDDGATILGYGFLINGQTEFTLQAPIDVGSHTITATYINFDGNYNPSSDSLIQVVTQVASTTTITSSLNPSFTGQDVTFTATVTPTGTTTVPTGTVTFSINGVLGAPVPLVNGQASITTSTVPVGNNNTIIALYSGDTIFLPSDDSLTQVVNQIPTTTTLVSSLNPAMIGDNVTFTATVTPNIATGLPLTGTVTFSIGGVLQPPVPVVNGQATFTTSTLPLGTTVIIATYSGDTNFITSVSPPLDEVIILIPAPPTNLKICQQKVIFSTQKEYQNVITGQASPSAGQVVQFRIYRDSALTVLAGTVPANGNRFVFIDHNVVKNVKYTYYIVSVNSAGVVSSPAVISN